MAKSPFQKILFLTLVVVSFFLLYDQSFQQASKDFNAV